MCKTGKLYYSLHTWRSSEAKKHQRDTLPRAKSVARRRDQTRRTNSCSIFLTRLVESIQKSTTWKEGEEWERERERNAKRKWKRRLKSERGERSLRRERLDQECWMVVPWYTLLAVYLYRAPVNSWERTRRLTREALFNAGHSKKKKNKKKNRVKNVEERGEEESKESFTHAIERYCRLLE